MFHPGVALGAPYGEGKVAAAQARMSAFRLVCRRTSPVLGKEHRQVATGRTEVGRVKWSQGRVTLDTGIKAVDQLYEPRRAAGAREQRRPCQLVHVPRIR